MVISRVNSPVGRFQSPCVFRDDETDGTQFKNREEAGPSLGCWA
jgi:hypothetical protein